MVEILVVGLGPIGVFWILAQSPRVRLSAVARSNAAAVTEHGLRFESKVFGSHLWRPKVYNSVEEAAREGPAFDFVLVSTKWVPEISDTASLLRPLLELEKLPVVALLQNGLGIEGDLQHAFPELHIISTIAWGNANVSNASDIPTFKHGTLHRIGCGLYEGPDMASVAAFDETRRQEGRAHLRLLASLLTEGGGEPETHDNIQLWRFIKLLWNGSWSLLSCMSRLSTYDLCLPDNVDATVIAIRGFVDEISAVAKALGYDIPEDRKQNTIDFTLEGARSGGIIWPGFKPSLFVDLESGRPMEFQSCVGSIISRARDHHVPTPKFDLVYAALRPHQLAAVAKAKGTSEVPKL